jgi:hypothetical protein
MENTLKKIRFMLALFLLPFRIPGERNGLYDDFVRRANESFREDFNRVPVHERAILLPHCLIHQKCPAKFSKEDGILCVQCKLCGCGEIKALCEERGMQFYITPSVGFTKRLAERKKLIAAAGATCSYEIGQGIRSTRITMKGVDLKRRKVVPQVVLTSRYDCLNNDMDWEVMKKIILNGA